MIKNKELIEKVENLYDELIEDKSKEYYRLLKEKYCSNKKPKISETHLITSSILSEQGYKISETTVYRILKVRDKDLAIFEDIKNNKLKIKEAYEICFPPKKNDDPTKRRNVRYLSMSDMIDIVESIENSINRIESDKNVCFDKKMLIKKIDILLDAIENFYARNEIIFDIEDEL